MKIFDTPPKPGMPISHPTFFRAFLRMARAWEKLSVSDGHVDWSNGIPTIVVDPGGAEAGGGGIDTDHVYVGGKTYTPGEKTTDFLQVNADGSSSWVAAIANPMPAGSEQFDVTKNEIHITGATAGNI